MPAPAGRRVLWDVFEEHLDEAAFGWAQWQSALQAANYTLGEVAEGPEARLLAHLDALALGEAAVAERLLLPALEADEPERIAAAAWALVQLEGGDYQDPVIDLLVKGPPPVRAAVTRALALSPRVDSSRVARLWTSDAPAVRAAVFEVLGAREPAWTAQHLDAVLGGDESAPVAGALRAMRRRAPDRALIGHVEAALRSDIRETRREAITTGIVLECKSAWDACRRLALRAGDGCRLPLALLATSPLPTDRAVVVAFARDPKVKRHAVWALGFAGDVEAADVLVAAATDEKVAASAGEALAAITGVVIEGPLVKSDPGQDGDAGDGASDAAAEDAAPPPAVHPEDRLAVPDPAALERWWREARGRFPPGVRHIAGRPRTTEAIRAALASAPMWRREVLSLELARATGGPPAVDLDAWARDQARALGLPLRVL